MAREGASVSSAAAGAGWNDLSAFYRAFRKQTGEAPQVWRRRMVGGSKNDKKLQR
jgi:AraC-like DNA-binding protein